MLPKQQQTDTCSIAPITDTSHSAKNFHSSKYKGGCVTLHQEHPWQKYNKCVKGFKSDLTNSKPTLNLIS